MKKVQDYYFKKAKQENYKARSVYKLEEAQKKFNFIKSSDNVLDVGCSPGSFSQYMLDKILKTGSVVGIDIQECTFKHQRFTFIHSPIETLDFSLLPFNSFDVIVSDAMPNTTSDKTTNHFRSLTLANNIFRRTKELLKEGGHFFIKVYDGADLPAFKNELTANFTKVSFFKPHSSREESRELFLFGFSKK